MKKCSSCCHPIGENEDFGVGDNGDILCVKCSFNYVMNKVF